MADDHEHDWLRHDDRLDGKALASCAACGPCASCAARTPSLGPEQADAALAALRALAAPAPAPDRPLPGEDAAVAAFLAARRAAPSEQPVGAGGVVASRHTADDPVARESGHPHRSGEPGERWERAGRDGARGSGTGPRGRCADRGGRHGTLSLPHRRPARAVLVAALAACALSGVAVLSGVVAVPTPFTAAGREPAAVDDRAGTVGGDGPHTTRPRPHGSASDGPADGRAGGGRDGKGADGRLLPPPAGPSPSGHGTPRPGERPSAGRGAGADRDEETASPYQGDPDADPQRALGLCRDYLTRGKWREQADEDAVHALERRAGGPSGVRAYCTRLVHDHDQVAGDGNGNGSGGDGSDEENENDKEGGADGGGDADDEDDRGSDDGSARRAGEARDTRGDHGGRDDRDDRGGQGGQGEPESRGRADGAHAG